MISFEAFMERFDDHPRDVDPSNGTVRMVSGAERPVRSMRPETVRPIILHAISFMPQGMTRELGFTVVENAAQRFEDA